jgi:hypothetical protein
MCFSASASFTASAALALIGASFVMRVRPPLRALAMLPLFFALQQFSEGFVWLSLPEVSFFKNIFLFFAYFFWPVWVPFSFWIAERDAKNKQLLFLCLILGIVVGTAYGLVIPETTPVMYRHSIHYASSHQYSNEAIYIGTALYGIATIAPFFISTLRNAWTVGSLILLSGIIVYWIDHFYFVSMWCFVSAIISLTLLFILKSPKTSHG